MQGKPPEKQGFVYPDEALKSYPCERSENTQKSKGCLAKHASKDFQKARKRRPGKRADRAAYINPSHRAQNFQTAKPKSAQEDVGVFANFRQSTKNCARAYFCTKYAAQTARMRTLSCSFWNGWNPRLCALSCSWALWLAHSGLPPPLKHSHVASSGKPFNPSQGPWVLRWKGTRQSQKQVRKP